MKKLLFLLLILSLSIPAQEISVLKEVDSKRLKADFVKSNYQMNIILTHLKNNYKVTADKYDIIQDEEMGNTECGFTVDFEKNIKYWTKFKWIHSNSRSIKFKFQKSKN